MGLFGLTRYDLCLFIEPIYAKLKTILENQILMTKAIDDLTAQVAANKTVTDSAITLLHGIADRIKEAGADEKKLAALAADLRSETDALAAAVSENTPAAEPTP